MENKIKRKLSFREMAVGELRRHRWCGDAFSKNGWPSVNRVLAQYALEKRKERLGNREGINREVWNERL